MNLDYMRCSISAFVDNMQPGNHARKLAMHKGVTNQLESTNSSQPLLIAVQCCVESKIQYAMPNRLLKQCQHLHNSVKSLHQNKIQTCHGKQQLQACNNAIIILTMPIAQRDLCTSDTNTLNEARHTQRTDAEVTHHAVKCCPGCQVHVPPAFHGCQLNH